MTVLKYVAWVLAGLAAIVLLIALIGWTLPVKHRAARRTTLPAPPARIYALITDAASFPSWRSKVTSVEVLPPTDGKMTYREVGDDGKILYVVDDAVPDQRLVTRIADPSLPFGGRWLFTLRSVDGGTELEIVEEGEVYNPIFRFVSRFVMGHTATIDGYLADLARRVGPAS